MHPVWRVKNLSNSVTPETPPPQDPQQDSVNASWICTLLLLRKKWLDEMREWYSGYIEKMIREGDDKTLTRESGDDAKSITHSSDDKNLTHSSDDTSFTKSTKRSPPKLYRPWSTEISKILQSYLSHHCLGNHSVGSNLIGKVQKAWNDAHDISSPPKYFHSQLDMYLNPPGAHLHDSAHFLNRSTAAKHNHFVWKNSDDKKNRSYLMKPMLALDEFTIDKQPTRIKPSTPITTAPTTTSSINNVTHKTITNTSTHKPQSNHTIHKPPTNHPTHKTPSNHTIQKPSSQLAQKSSTVGTTDRHTKNISPSRGHHHNMTVKSSTTSQRSMHQSMHQSSRTTTFTSQEVKSKKRTIQVLSEDNGPPGASKRRRIQDNSPGRSKMRTPSVQVPNSRASPRGAVPPPSFRLQNTPSNRGPIFSASPSAQLTPPSGTSSQPQTPHSAFSQNSLSSSYSQHSGTPQSWTSPGSSTSADISPNLGISGGVRLMQPPPPNAPPAVHAVYQQQMRLVHFVTPQQPSTTFQRQNSQQQQSNNESQKSSQQ